MVNILNNLGRLISTPGMLTAYSNWISTKYLLKNSPSISCVNATKISGLASFSEYWSFYKGIPESEQKLMQNCLEQCSGQSVAIDIGANIGFFTVALSSFGYSQVHAFEPVPEIFSLLSKNLSSNKLDENVFLNCLGVSDKRGSIEFQIFEKSPAINRLAISNESKTNKTQKVSVIQLDEYCSSKNIKKIDFLKIDVEGMENLVLKGARNLLSNQKISVVLIEICPNNLIELGFTVRELYDSLIGFGYETYRLNNEGLIQEKLSLSHLENIKLENIVAIPNMH